MPSDETETLQATVLVVDDIAANRNVLRQTLEKEGYEILMAPDGKTALKVAATAQPDVILLDVMMPGMNGFETCQQLKQDESTQSIPVIFISAQNETQSMVEGFKAGGVDYITKPFQAEEVLIRVHTHLTNHRLNDEVRRKNRELEQVNEQLRSEINRREQAETSLQVADDQLSLVSRLDAERWGIDRLVGTTPSMARIVDQIRKLQPATSTSVLITGESGTGKELVARALHFGGSRSKKPFLPVNCSAVPRDLAESLFFGHVKGAFSGATETRKGYFENAEGGTLFLDEVGDMSADLQAKLLRVLESGKILPLGASEERPVDVRIVAATNADLQAEVETGGFREDLYFRLASYIVDVPSLSQRREDIPLLVDHFLEMLSLEMSMPKPPVSKEALNALSGYEFPGNIRELRNILERAMIDSGGGMILPEHLPIVVGKTELPSEAAPASTSTRANDEETRILDYVREHGAINNAQCRQLLDVSIHRAWYLLRKLSRNGQLIQGSSKRWARYHLPN